MLTQNSLHVKCTFGQNLCSGLDVRAGYGHTDIF